MNTKNFGINNVRIASPCSVGWDSMSGDERTRHCEKCSLSVFNISALTASEIEKLILGCEGRLCIRMYRRGDGTVLTRDCPVGLRAVQKRVTRLAGATLAAVIGLFSVSYGQKDDNKPLDASKIKIERSDVAVGKSVLTGTVMDENGAVIPGAGIVLSNGKQEIEANSDSSGVYSLAVPTAGTYDLKVINKFLGFEEYQLTNLRVDKNERLELNIELKVKEGELVGMLATEPALIDSTPITIPAIPLAPRKLEKLRHP